MSNLSDLVGFALIVTARYKKESRVWTSCSVENMHKVFKLQKRAARVILGADTKANSVQLFRKLDWVPFFHEAK